MNFVLDFIITVVAYMLFPFILFKVMKKRYSKKKTYIINLINSLIIMTCFIAVRSFLGENTTTSGAPALLYLMINNLLYPIKTNQVNSGTINSSGEEEGKNRAGKKKIDKKKVKSKSFKPLIIGLICIFLGIGIFLTYKCITQEIKLSKFKECEYYYKIVDSEKNYNYILDSITQHTETESIKINYDSYQNLKLCLDFAYK